MTAGIMSVLLSIPAGLLLAYFMVRTVKTAHAPVYLLLTAADIAAGCALSELVGVEMQIWVSILSILAALMLPQLFTRESRSWTLLCTLAYCLTAVLAEGTLAAVLSPLAESRGETIASLMCSDPVFVMITKLTVLAIFGGYAAAFRYLLLRRLPPDSTEDLNFLFFMVPLSQLVTLGVLAALLEELGGASGAPVLLLVTAVSILADASYFRAIHRLRRQTVLEKQVAMARRELNSQTEEYRRLEESMTLVNQIRHDLNNQLHTVYRLLENGERAEAEGLLDTLHRDLTEKGGTRFCANPVVDAVLTEKENLCREKGIGLEIQMELPPQIPIPGAHLCGVFVNLMDNAVAGCLESGAEAPKISLRAGVKQGYLIVRCENTAAPKENARVGENGPVPTHGVGQTILRDFAQTYGGNFSARRQDGQYVATVILKLSAPDEALASDGS